MARLTILLLASVGVTLMGAAQATRVPARFSVVEATIPDLRRAMETGRTTSRAITEQYLARIERQEKTLNAVITLNSGALAEADARDRERRLRKVRGPLHGVPIALKDNIQTTGMPTTGNAMAFATLRAPYEATLTTLLREAGAVIIAKTTMTELANWVATGMPSGYGSLAGFSFNPYDTRPGTRGEPLMTPGGSSSGIGTAASLWAANVGTETSGSILNPASQTGLVGIKPTVGRISRHGIIPLAAEQDTAGPMARTVTDAAILLGALEGAAPDPNDEATGRCAVPQGRDYTRHLRREGLKGSRIGVPRAYFMARLSEDQRRLMTDAIATLRRQGATIVDPADLPSVTTTDRERSILEWSFCRRGDSNAGPSTCSIVLRYGMKRDFNRWLNSLGSAAPVKSLTELRAWNRAHDRDGALRFGQDQLDSSDDIDLAVHRARYLADRAKDVELAGRDGIDAALRANRLDALLFPSYFASFIPARAGYPSIIVPAGMTKGASLPGARPPDARPEPFGVTFTGTACSEPRLIELAYAFEQATRRRVPPNVN
jgi:amidase